MLIREFQRAKRTNQVIGIMLHHRGYDRPKLEVLRNFVSFLTSSPALSFSLIEEVADDLAES